MLSYDRHLAAVETASARLADVVAGADLELPVPSCPDWDLADLVWHLTEVQRFWATVVAERSTGPPDTRAVRPPTDDLRSAFADATGSLVSALRSTDPATACWSWHEGGRSARWVARRQAHEATIHRLDAELATDRVTPLDDDVALDGVDEILTVFLTGVPDWGMFTPGPTTVTLTARPSGHRWSLRLGRFGGTSPRTGTTHDLPAAELIDHPRRPDATIETEPRRLDAWLWGRASLPPDALSGDASAVDRLRALAADATS